MTLIKEIDIENRPREKAIKNGINALTNHELLAIILRSGSKDKSAIDIAKELLNDFKSLNELLNCNIHNLMKYKGIKKAKAIEILASIELAKRASREKRENKKSIRGAIDVYEMLKDELMDEKQEKFIVLYLNIKLKIIKQETLFIGGECCSLIDTNLIFKHALEYGSRNIICIHNHPSGDPSPSQEDVSLTKKIREIANIVNIKFLDHIIISKDDYFSFAKMKL